ncbi:MAG: hypothetical protein B6244_11880 [Candidatus Cloacimonetes bacterium 4572_55]|nr:MAG: hypothetical protein B6244_11880 [Candidatus Cloacimonetes bacterium 4572_55]
MKKSLLIQFVILLSLVVLANIVRVDSESAESNEPENREDNGINVDFDGDRKVFCTSSDLESPRFGGVLTLAISGEPEHLNPITSTSSSARRFNENIYESLLGYDYRTWRRERPILAKRFEISPDHKTFTFYLHENIFWQDGKPLTAEDVLFSLKAILNPFVDAVGRRSSYSSVSEAWTEGPYKFLVRTSDTYFLNLESLGEFFVLPKHIWDPDGLMDPFTVSDLINPGIVNRNPDIRSFGESFNKHPQGRPAGMDADPMIGSGPWKFKHWITGEYASLTRNDKYWNADITYVPGFSEKGGYLDEVIIRFISDWTAKLTSLKSGDIDFAPRLRPIQYFEQTRSPYFLEHFQKVIYVTTAYGYLGWNNDRPFFSDKRVRQAMTMLIDRESYNRYISYNINIPTVGPFYLYGEQYNHDIEPLPYDPERAVELIEETGWIDHDDDGIRDKDGVPFRFDFSVSSGSKNSRKLALMLKEDLRRIGIEMGIRSLEWAVYVENLRDHQFDVVNLLSVLDLQSDPYHTWHSDNIGNRGSNYSGFRNAEADSVIDLARYETDPDKRNALLFRLQEILHEEQPYTFMHSIRNMAAYDKRFQGVKWVPVSPNYKIWSWQLADGTGLAPAP